VKFRDLFGRGQLQRDPTPGATIVAAGNEVAGSARSSDALVPPGNFKADVTLTVTSPVYRERAPEDYVQELSRKTRDGAIAALTERFGGSFADSVQGIVSLEGPEITFRLSGVRAADQEDLVYRGSAMRDVFKRYWADALQSTLPPEQTGEGQNDVRQVEQALRRLQVVDRDDAEVNLGQVRESWGAKGLIEIRNDDLTITLRKIMQGFMTEGVELQVKEMYSGTALQLNFIRANMFRPVRMIRIGEELFVAYGQALLYQVLDDR
jgi:hypothetical protein